MKHAIARSAILALAVVGPSWAADRLPLPLPADLAHLKHQIEGCAYLGGEVGSGDPRREAELRQSAERLGCDDDKIARSIRRLRSKYADAPVLLQELNDSLGVAKDIHGIEY